MDDDRKRYWNETYYRYWKARVEESNQSDPVNQSTKIQSDSKTAPDLTYLNAIAELGIRSEHSLLELGCGFGRKADTLYDLTKNLTFVDISEAMIEVARSDNKHRPEIQFYLSEAEKLPFTGENFDRIMCFGTFDALFQKEALIEMNRVLKLGGKLYVTGKNDLYFEDDEQALVAEQNARAKGHPNYFTDVKMLLEHLNVFGLSQDKGKFYLKRGDTFSDQYVKSLPPYHYEFALLLTKTGPVQHNRTASLTISSPISKTFQKKNVS